MDVDWDSLRTQLDGDFHYGDRGDWFYLPEQSVRKASTGRPFDENKAQKGLKGRRVVLSARVKGPNATGFPRSTKRGKPRDFHPRHCPEHVETCEIDKDGWVVLDIPVVVLENEIAETTYSCSEPEETGLLAAIERRLRP